jgi:hypothetical protein
MAYVHKDVITKARAALKVLNKQYGVKATLSGENTSSLKLTIAQGGIDFIGNYCENVLAKRIQHDTDSVITWVQREMYIQVNQYYLDSSFSGIALEYLEKAKEIMYVDHWDKSDIMTDYFNCSYYVNINVGRWNKGYILKSN